MDNIKKYGICNILTSNPLFSPEVGGTGFLQNAGKWLPRCPVFHLRTEDFSFIQIASSENIPYESVTNGFMFRSRGRPAEFSGKIENVNKAIKFVTRKLGLWHPILRVQTRPKPLDFYGRKNPQHAFLRRGSKRICPMSQLCGM